MLAFMIDLALIASTGALTLAVLRLTDAVRQLAACAEPPRLMTWDATREGEAREREGG